MGLVPYFGLLGLIGLQRLLELRRSALNRHRLLAQGAREVGQGHYPWMVAMHSAFLPACALEAWAFSREWTSWGFFFCGILLLATGLRWWAITTLGERWTTRVMILSGSKRIRRGPYQYLNHPNYLAVILEMLAVPMILGNYWTALIFSALNAVVLGVRIRGENQALIQAELKP